MINVKNIGKKIKDNRLKQNITQMQLAEMCDISSVHLSHIETGKVVMSLDCMLRICKALKVTPNNILINEYDVKSQTDGKIFSEYIEPLTKDEIVYLIESAKLLADLKLNRKN